MGMDSNVLAQDRLR